MLRPILATLCCCTTLAAPALQAGEIYRVVGPDGSVHFTDSPPEDARAEVVDVGPVNTVPGLRQPPPPPPAPPPVYAPVTYKSITLTGVSPEQQLVNPDSPLNIAVVTDVPLAPNHTLVIRYDGQEVSRGQQALYVIDRPDRGQHSVSAEILDETGRQLIAAPPVVFYVKRNIAR